MSNEKELVLFCREDGKWAVYDDTYDITIHCESQQEQDKAMELLRKANQDACEVMSLEEMAHCLMDACHCHLATGNGCQGCPLTDHPPKSAAERAALAFLPTGIFEEVAG